MLAPGAPSGGIKANPIKGVVGTEAGQVIFDLQSPGATHLGREVRVYAQLVKQEKSGALVVEDVVRTDIDNLFRTSDGKLVNVESKFGAYAKFTDNQRTIWQWLREQYGVNEGWVVVIPDASPATINAGLTPGEPVQIFFTRLRFNWPLGGL